MLSDPKLIKLPQSAAKLAFAYYKVLRLNPGIEIMKPLLSLLMEQIVDKMYDLSDKDINMIIKLISTDKIVTLLGEMQHEEHEYLNIDFVWGLIL